MRVVLTALYILKTEFLIGTIMDVNDNKQTIAAMYNAVAQGDTSVFAKACHRDYVWRFPGHYSWA